MLDMAADKSEKSPLESRTGWNDLPGELRNQIYEYALVGCRRQLGNLPTNRCKFNLPLANKQIHKEFSSFDDGRFQVNLDIRDQGIPRDFNFSRVKELEIIWDRSSGSVATCTEQLQQFVHGITALSVLTQRLIPADGLERLTIRITNIPQEMAGTGSSVLVGALMPWVRAVQAKLDKAEAEGRKWTVEGEIDGTKCQFKKSALDLLELLPSGEWDVNARESRNWAARFSRKVKRKISRCLGVSFMGSTRFAV